MLERQGKPADEDEGGCTDKGSEVHRDYFGNVYQFRWAVLHFMFGFGNPKVQVRVVVGNWLSVGRSGDRYGHAAVRGCMAGLRTLHFHGNF